MRRYLIASHGVFASGIKSSAEIILGKCDNLDTIDAYVEENRPIKNELDAILEKVADSDEMIVFTDLMGGSVTNAVVLAMAQRPNVYILSGMNLPLIVEVLSIGDTMPIDELLEMAVLNAKEQIVDVKKKMMNIDDL